MDDKRIATVRAIEDPDLAMLDDIAVGDEQEQVGHTDLAEMLPASSQAENMG